MEKFEEAEKREMFWFTGLGKILIVFGLSLTAMGVLFLIIPKVPWLGKLPGDIVFHKGDFGFYFPWVTCLLISALVTLFLYLFRK